MLPAFHMSCTEMMRKWETIVSSTEGSCELDVWPHIGALSSDVISRAAFGSNYEEGKRIFQLQKEQADLTIAVLNSVYIPGWSFLPTKRNKRMKEICKEVHASLREIINKRVNLMAVKKAQQGDDQACIDDNRDDLLGILLESNLGEIEHQNGKKKNDKKEMGVLSMKEVIEECKLFYLAGQETSSSLIGWTMVLLARHQIWQARAREEVFQVFGSHNLGDKQPDFDGLSRLKIVTMILYEVLRLYPPIDVLTRSVKEDVKLGGGRLSLSAGVELTLPVILVHRNEEIWGDDAAEFNPERFSEGVSKATEGNLVSFFPFSWGPRICIGQNFALLQAKMAMALILQRFSFELSPSYAHAPFTVVALQPQYGADLILQKL